MSNKYDLVVGLEIHAELSTNSKIYCSCKNKFGLEVNSVCCPICTGMPGTLPTLNKKVVEYAIKMGLATNRLFKKIDTSNQIEVKGELLKKLQETLLDMLKDFASLCEKYGFYYSLCG